ncbi:unnamed protein product [Linum trigynum]|uniref:Uncharacterized protein n=1 Tax=Linum trigynum TaxID=586398 RepID=A0AAV2DVQ7_9ROSI
MRASPRRRPDLRNYASFSKATRRQECCRKGELARATLSTDVTNLKMGLVEIQIKQAATNAIVKSLQEELRRGFL